MKGKDAVNDGVDRLAVVEGVGDKAEVARRCGEVEVILWVYELLN